MIPRGAVLLFLSHLVLAQAQNVTFQLISASYPPGVSVTYPPESNHYVDYAPICGTTLEVLSPAFAANIIFTGVSASVILVWGLNSAGPALLLDGNELEVTMPPNPTAQASDCQLANFYTPALQYGQHNLTVSGASDSPLTYLRFNSFEFDPGSPPGSSTSASTSGMAPTGQTFTSLTDSGVASAIPSTGALPSPSSNSVEEIPGKRSSDGPIIGGVVVAVVVLIAGGVLGFIFLRRRAREVRGGNTGEDQAPVYRDYPGRSVTVVDNVQVDMSYPPSTTGSTPWLAPAPTETSNQDSSEKLLLRPTYGYNLQNPSEAGLGDRSSVGISEWPGSSSSGIQSGGRPMTEIEVIQGLMERNLPTPALTAAIELMASARVASPVVGGLETASGLNMPVQGTYGGSSVAVQPSLRSNTQE